MTFGHQHQQHTQAEGCFRSTVRGDIANVSFIAVTCSRNECSYSLAASGGSVLAAHAALTRSFWQRPTFPIPTPPTQERFNYPKAIIGVADHPGRRPLSAQFDIIKAAENEETRERIEARPCGQRYQAAAEFRERLEALRTKQAEEEDREQRLTEGIRPYSHRQREFASSPNNPLIPGGGGSSTSLDSDDELDGGAWSDSKSCGREAAVMTCPACGVTSPMKLAIISTKGISTAAAAPGLGGPSGGAHSSRGCPSCAPRSARDARSGGEGESEQRRQRHRQRKLKELARKVGRLLRVVFDDSGCIFG